MSHGETIPALPESAPRFQPDDAQFAEAGFDGWPGPLLAFISVSYKASACLTTSCKNQEAHIQCKLDKTSCAYLSTASRLVASARLKLLPNLPDKSSHFFLTQKRSKYHRNTIRTTPSTHLASSSYSTPNKSDRPADFAVQAISTTTSLCTKAC